jgi:hypothetical protein
MVKQTGPLKELTREDISTERARAFARGRMQALWDMTGKYGTRIKNRKAKDREGINDDIDDLQIDAYGFAPFYGLALAFLPPFSTNLPSDELILVDGLGGSGVVEQERPVLDFERYWEVGALGDGILEIAMGDETPGAGL